MEVGSAPHHVRTWAFIASSIASAFFRSCSFTITLAVRWCPDLLAMLWDYSIPFPQRAFAAFIAISFFLSGVNVIARLAPPILPPRLPSSAITRDTSDLVTAGGSGVSMSGSVVACTRKCASWFTSRGLFGRAWVFVAGFGVFLVAIPQVWHGVLKRLKRKIFKVAHYPIRNSTSAQTGPNISSLNCGNAR